MSLLSAVARHPNTVFLAWVYLSTTIYTVWAASSRSKVLARSGALVMIFVLCLSYQAYILVCPSRHSETWIWLCPPLAILFVCWMVLIQHRPEELMGLSDRLL